MDDDTFELPIWSRTYADYRSRFVENYELDLGHLSISLAQAPCVSADHAREAKASADGSCTAGTVWDAGIVLAAHVFDAYRASTNNADDRSGNEGTVALRCLDLGSGTGIVGLAAAASGGFSRVVLTDLPSVTPLLERNTASNSARMPTAVQIEAVPMRWDDDDELRRVAELGPFDLIVGGDLLYRPQVVPPLLYALSRMMSRHTRALFAASLQHSPETIRLFTQTMSAEGYDVQLLGPDAQSERARSEEVRMLCVTRQKRKKKRGGGKERSSKRPAAASVASPGEDQS